MKLDALAFIKPNFSTKSNLFTPVKNLIPYSYAHLISIDFRDFGPSSKLVFFGDVRSYGLLVGEKFKECLRTKTKIVGIYGIRFGTWLLFGLW